MHRGPALGVDSGGAGASPVLEPAVAVVESAADVDSSTPPVEVPGSAGISESASPSVVVVVGVDGTDPMAAFGDGSS